MSSQTTASKRPAPNALPDFQNIGTRTWLYTPPKPMPGHLITICTWLGASPKHISKYTSLYRRIAPGAKILLIESSVPILVSAYAHQRRMVLPAVSVVLDTLDEVGFLSTTESSDIEKEEREKPRIMLHTFSNGGTNTLTQLLITLSPHLRGTGPLPLSGILFDSAPAKGTYKKSYDAMVLSLPKDLISQTLGAVVVHGLLVLLYAWIAWGNENPAGLMRRTLLDEEKIEYVDREKTIATAVALNGNVNSNSTLPAGEKPPVGRACYIYSKADKMVEWTDIADHAEDARQNRWFVEEVVFDDTGHCQHYTRDEERYEGAVRLMWGVEEMGGPDEKAEATSEKETRRRPINDERNLRSGARL